MPVVTITGNAWTHQGAPIPAAKHPELWFRPKAQAWGSDGLLVAVEAQATLNNSTGAFSVELVSEPGVYYQPVMRWLVNETHPTEQWAYEYAEWPFLFTPGEGGPIGDLINNFPPGVIIAALGPPVDAAANVVWIDLLDQTDEGAQVYAPAGSY